MTDARAGEGRTEGCHPECAQLGERFVHSSLCGSPPAARVRCDYEKRAHTQGDDCRNPRPVEVLWVEATVEYVRTATVRFMADVNDNGIYDSASRAAPIAGRFMRLLNFWAHRGGQGVPRIVSVRFTTPTEVETPSYSDMDVSRDIHASEKRRIGPDYSPSEPQ